MELSDILYGKERNASEFNFDNLSALPISFYLSDQDVAMLHEIASSLKWAANVRKKYKAMDEIMKNRGFVHMACGTNRRVYRYLEDDSFVFKVAVDRVGLEDNPKEFYNQTLLRPYVTKMFHCTPCGTVSSVEKVVPIRTREEFAKVSDQVFDFLYGNILGKYVLEDIGAKHFMNYGVRAGFGPCLLDYPYLYEVDGNKLQCKEMTPYGVCNGEIGYDIGINELHCSKCGKEYSASSLQKYVDSNEITVINEDIDYKAIANLEFRIIDSNGNVLAEKEKESEIIV